VTIRHARAEAPARSPHEIQREHELGEALSAARHLQARLELLGDHDVDVAAIRSLRDRLAGELQPAPARCTDVNGPPCQGFSS
jgi:hypothetical protein